MKKIKERLFELKQDAWESDRNAEDYIKGYWWGVYWTCLEIEKIYGKGICATREEATETGKGEK